MNLLTTTKATGGGFVPLPRREVPRASEPRPEAKHGDDLLDGEAGLVVLLRAGVRRELAELAYRRAPRETAGLLGGRLGQDDRGAFAVIEAAVEAEISSAGPAHVQFTGSSLNAARTRLEREHPGLVAVGWWHTHPSMDAFYSSEDRREQATWPDARHVGIVLGGRGEKLAFFHGPRSIPLVPVRPGFKALAPEPWLLPTAAAVTLEASAPEPKPESADTRERVDAFEGTAAIPDLLAKLKRLALELRGLDLDDFDADATPRGAPSERALIVRARLSSRDAVQALTRLSRRLAAG